ncbi:MAG TPA: DUF4446 family protein [Candidatus Pullilachnospira stercoravium]|uniref:DUF4446 family protein n=1 Tax=Candidatus Pullilachnospira stercoravium TaxID=2840913 RepID=A0A9D1NVL5_9FIRM|nr:DUF4446 family protein [Candidatus Pullilachnospira stercoravium]
MDEIFARIGIDQGILVLLLMVLVLILIVVFLNVSLALHRLNRKYTMFMKGADGQSLERMFSQKMKEFERLARANEDNSLELRQMKSVLKKTPTKYGIIKYDAFDDVGGKLSFALAMLDAENTGFILNAIHSRDNCFFYIKEIVNGESYTLLSSEETDALRQAVHFNEVE